MAWPKSRPNEVSQISICCHDQTERKLQGNPTHSRPDKKIWGLGWVSANQKKVRQVFAPGLLFSWLSLC